MHNGLCVFVPHQGARSMKSAQVISIRLDENAWIELQKTSKRPLEALWNLVRLPLFAHHPLWGRERGMITSQMGGRAPDRDPRTSPGGSTCCEASLLSFLRFFTVDCVFFKKTNTRDKKCMGITGFFCGLTRQVLYALWLLSYHYVRRLNERNERIPHVSFRDL